VAVAGVVGHGVGKGASFLKRGFRSKKDDDSESTNSDIPTITTNGPGPSPGMGLKRSTGLSFAGGDVTPPSPPGTKTAGAANGGGLLTHTRTQSAGASSVHSAIIPGASSGTASFTVATADGFPPSTDIYISITQVKDGKSKLVGKTKHRKAGAGSVKFDETFRISCTPDSQFKVEAKEHHTLKSDELLGEGLHFVDESNSGQEKLVKLGSGTVGISSSFTPTESSLSPDSPKSTSGNLRRGFMSKRESKAPSRETTPAL